MLGPHWRRVLLAALVAVAALGLRTGRAADRSHASPAGLIVFASDRAKLNNGEIYSLAPGTQARDITHSLAGEHDLAVAPRGDLIAFWSNRSGFDRVYLAHADGSRVRLVPGIGAGQTQTHQGNGALLQFAADGSLLIAVFSVGNATHDYAIDTRTAAARPLPPCGFVIAPSPDGGLIACSRSGNGPVSVYDAAGRVRFRMPVSRPFWSSRGWLTGSPASATAQRPVAVVDESGRTIGRVNGLPLAWSPDGGLLAFSRGTSLLVADPRSAGSARVIFRDCCGGGASFSPDGRQILTAGRAGKSVLIPVAGGPATPAAGAGSGVWSPDGRLAYLGTMSSYPPRPGVTFPVLVTDTQGHNPRVAGRFPFDDHGLGQLQWLPDARRVLLLTVNTCNGNDLFAVPSSGGVAQQVTNDPRNLQQPAWSPDGGRIAFTVSDFSCHMGAGGPMHIATAAPDGTTAQRVTDDGDPSQNGSFDSEPSFSPDRKGIAFSHGTFDQSSLQTAAVPGGARTTIVSSGGTSPAWSPDGTRIAYLSGTSVMAVAPTGGKPEVIVADVPGAVCGGGGLAWSPDGKELAVGGHVAGIYVITLGAPASVRLALRARCPEYPSFSPDGSQIAFDAAPPHPLGAQSAIMVGDVDGTSVRVLSTVPFRQSVHPSWQPVP